MEYLITILPVIFSIATGLLIAWSIQSSMSLIDILVLVKHHTRTSDVLRSCGILCATLFLFFILFVATEFAAFHMITILILEVWYAVYLYIMSLTVTYTKHRLHSS